MWGLGGGVKKNLGLGGLTNVRTEGGREGGIFVGIGVSSPLHAMEKKHSWILLNNQLFQRKSNQPGFNISGWNN